MMISYDKVRFRVPDEADSPTAQYHQDGDLVWAEFDGGRVRRGALVGTCDRDGVLTLAYCMVLRTGEVISGRTLSTPEWLDDGRIRLTERWERYGPAVASGISYLEQVPDGETGPHEGEGDLAGEGQGDGRGEGDSDGLGHAS